MGNSTKPKTDSACQWFHLVKKGKYAQLNENKYQPLPLISKRTCIRRFKAAFLETCFAYDSSPRDKQLLVSGRSVPCNYNEHIRCYIHTDRMYINTRSKDAISSDSIALPVLNLSRAESDTYPIHKKK
jgi:hypothetical protein